MRKSFRDGNKSDRSGQVPALIDKSRQLKSCARDQIDWRIEAKVCKHGNAGGAFAADADLLSALDFLEADKKAYPPALRVFDQALYDRIEALVSEVDVDLDKPLSLEDD